MATSLQELLAAHRVPAEKTKTTSAIHSRLELQTAAIVPTLTAFAAGRDATIAEIAAGSGFTAEYTVVGLRKTLADSLCHGQGGLRMHRTRKRALCLCAENVSLILGILPESQQEAAILAAGFESIEAFRTWFEAMPSAVTR